METVLDTKIGHLGHFTPVLDHNFVCIIFRIHSKVFSILNDHRVPSLKQSDNSGYFGKTVIPKKKHFTPD